MTVLPSRPALDEIDQDLHAACVARHEAWRAMCIKDNDANRDDYHAACADVDNLLDLRNAMIVAEGMVTP